MEDQTDQRHGHDVDQNPCRGTQRVVGSTGKGHENVCQRTATAAKDDDKTQRESSPFEEE